MKCKIMMITAILLPFLLSGCRQSRLQPISVVTCVDVVYDRGYQILRRQYTNPEKVSMVLNYLRLQKDLGPPDVDPLKTFGDRMKIDVTMSNGTHRLYYQQSGKFLSGKNQVWHKIDPKRAFEFQLRLQMIPTDEKSPA